MLIDPEGSMSIKKSVEKTRAASVCVISLSHYDTWRETKVDERKEREFPVPTPVCRSSLIQHGRQQRSTDGRESLLATFSPHAQAAHHNITFLLDRNVPQ